MSMRPNFAILYLPLLAVLFALSIAVDGAAAFDLPPVQRGQNLDDCTAKLNKQGGGWCEIWHSQDTASIASVWPKNLDSRTQMVVGPAAVLAAWNGGAIDVEDRLFYFMGGGHADYGGNEVYEFDLNKGQWTRLTDPSPLTFLSQARAATATTPAIYCWVPDIRVVPGSAHTYDGLQFSRLTRTLFFAMSAPADGACFGDAKGQFKDDPRIITRNGGQGLFEFNPSRTETRNNLKPLSWRRVTEPGQVQLAYPRSLELPDGSMLIGSSTELWEFNPVTGKIGGHVGSQADYGDGTAIFYPPNNVLSLHARALLIGSLKVPSFGRIPANPFTGKSMAVAKNGIVYSWDGATRVVTIDPRQSNATWKLYDWAGSGPPAGTPRVYSKWQYLPKQDVFVGLASNTTGVWVYKQPADMPGLTFANVDPQQLIDAAKLGSVVTLPPGVYGSGLFINKSLTVELKGVHLYGVSNNKGIINVDCDNCKVTIDDFHAEGRQASCLWENCAGIKVEGKKFDLTVRRADIDDTVMGILTDNRGGRLVVEDSKIEDTGVNDHTDTLGHGLYAGKIDELIVRRTTIRNVNGDGHLLKSRAPLTTLEDVRLLGEDGFHSRSIDFPCGGKLVVDNSVIQHSRNTDNTDIIAVGTEANNCGGLVPGDISITNSWIIDDRTRAEGERSREYGPNVLFRWRAPMKSLVFRGNHVVNVQEWSTSETDRGDIALPDLRVNNQVCKDRAACGLKTELP